MSIAVVRHFLNSKTKFLLRRNYIFLRRRGSIVLKSLADDSLLENTTAYKSKN